MTATALFLHVCDGDAPLQAMKGVLRSGGPFAGRSFARGVKHDEWHSKQSTD